MNTLAWIVCLAFAYSMGSICSAIIVSHAFGLPDPTQEGSKNPGATNVLRLAGKQYAIYVLLADILKGTIPVLIVKLAGVSPSLIGYTCLAAVLGHMYPVFFSFKGGKGVATMLGVLLGLNFYVGGMAILTWIGVATLFRYSSLASIFTACLAPFFAIMNVPSLDIFPPIILITIIIMYRHKENIVRLINGEEPTITLGKKANASEQTIDEVIKSDDQDIKTDDELPKL